MVAPVQLRRGAAERSLCSLLRGSRDWPAVTVPGSSLVVCMNVIERCSRGALSLVAALVQGDLQTILNDVFGTGSYTVTVTGAAQTALTAGNCRFGRSPD